MSSDIYCTLVHKTKSHVQPIFDMCSYKFHAGSLHEGVVSDVLWTAIADNIWIKNSPLCIARRFIASKSGVMRLFPGTRLPSNYDSSTREWYEIEDLLRCFVFHSRLLNFVPGIKQLCHITV